MDGDDERHFFARLRRRPAARYLALGVVAVLLVVGHQFFGLPGNLIGRTFQNALHIPAFASLGLTLAWCFPKWSMRVLIGCCLLIGIGLEGLQVLTERDASGMDLVLDLIGSTIAVVAMRGSGAAGSRLAGAVVAVAVLTLMLPVRVLFAYSHRDEIFPSLLDPGNWRQHPLLYSNSKLDVVQRRIDSDRSDNALRVCWADHQFPGLHFEETVADWSGYTTLAVDLEVLGGEPMRITAAIGHEGTAGTYAYVSETFTPGQSSWRVPLESLIRTKDGGPARISHFILHSRRAHKQQCVIFAQVRLE